jgi:DNA-3-methyladenine glycosylase I
MAGREEASERRCDWCLGDPLMVAYHDQEWGVPLHDDRRHFEFLVLDGAQAGLSWQTILRKRENYRRAFAGFEPAKIARFGARDVECLMGDAGIVRNRQKIHSAIANAGVFLELQEEFGGFDEYVWRFVDGATKVNCLQRLADIPAKTPESEAMSRDLKRRGMNFVGPTILYAYMQAAGMVNDHLVSCFRYAELAEVR